MIAFDPRRRITPAAALEHPYFDSIPKQYVDDDCRHNHSKHDARCECRRTSYAPLETKRSSLRRR